MREFNLYSLSMKDYRQFNKVELDFEKLNGLILTYGPNGSGKTNLFKGVNYCLFQEGSIRTQKKSIIRKGKKGAGVWLQMGIGNDKDYYIRRNSYLNDTTEFDIKINEEGVEIKNLNDFNKFVCDEIQLDYNIWKNTVYYSDESQNKLLVGTDKDRIDAAASMISFFELFDAKLKEVRKEKSLLVKKSSYAEGLLDNAERYLNEAKSKLKKLKKDLSKLKKKNEVNNDEIAFCEGKIKRREIFIKSHEKIINKRNKEIRSEDKNIHALEIRLRDIIKQIEQKGVVKECKKCEFNLKRLKKLQKEDDKLTIEIADRKDSLKEKIKEERKMEKDVDVWEREIEDYTDRKNELMEESNKKAIFTLNKVIDKEEELIDKQRRRLKKGRKRVGMYERAIKILEEKEHFYSSKGFKEWEIKERFFPFYYKLVNDMLETYGFDEYSLRGKKNGFIIKKYGREVNQKDLSTGERKVFSILFNEALCQMYEIFGNVSFGFRILDEPLAKLDKNNIGRILKLIEDMAEHEGLKIFLLTNLKEVMREYNHLSSIVLKPGKKFTKIKVNYGE